MAVILLVAICCLLIDIIVMLHGRFTIQAPDDTLSLPLAKLH